jgi:hypothetical protein
LTRRPLNPDRKLGHDLAPDRRDQKHQHESYERRNLQLRPGRSQDLTGVLVEESLGERLTGNEFLGAETEPDIRPLGARCTSGEGSFVRAADRNDDCNEVYPGTEAKTKIASQPASREQNGGNKN